MFSWLQQWQKPTKIEEYKVKKHEILSEKVMISPKSIAITKSTTVLVSGGGDNNLFQHYQQQQEPQPLLATSAASIALSTELTKSWNQHHANHSNSILNVSVSSSSIRSKQSHSSMISISNSSPPRHSSSHSTTTSNVSHHDTLTSHYIPTSIHTSPKRQANPLSTSVSVSGDLLHDTHMFVPSPVSLPSSNTPTQVATDTVSSDTAHSNSPIAAMSSSLPTITTTMPSEVSMISISKAERSLSEIIYSASLHNNGSHHDILVETDFSSSQQNQPLVLQNSESNDQQLQLAIKDNKLKPVPEQQQQEYSNRNMEPSVDQTISASSHQSDQIPISTNTATTIKRPSYWSFFWYSSTDVNTSITNTETPHHQGSPSMNELEAAGTSSTTNLESSSSLSQDNIYKKDHHQENNIGINDVHKQITSSNNNTTNDVVSPSISLQSTTSPKNIPSIDNPPMISSASTNATASSVQQQQQQQQPVTKKNRRSNYVLPSFQSQFSIPPSTTLNEPISSSNIPASQHFISPQTNTTIPAHTKQASFNAGKLFDKALESFNQFFSPLNKSSDLVTDPESWKQQMKSRFARFIEDMKSDPIGLAEKKVVVIGVHGWFPMKVNIYTYLYFFFY